MKTSQIARSYRAFLRHPTPRTLWVEPPRSRSLPEWKPFAGGLSARSAAYALTVFGFLYRWLMQQRYLLTNPFAGIKVRGAANAPSDATRGLSDSE